MGIVQFLFIDSSSGILRGLRIATPPQKAWRAFADSVALPMATKYDTWLNGLMRKSTDDLWGIAIDGGELWGMKLLSIKDLSAEIAKRTGLENMSASRIRVLVARWAEDIGATKVGRAWVVPDTGVDILVSKIDTSKRPLEGRGAPTRAKG